MCVYSSRTPCEIIEGAQETKHKATNLQARVTDALNGIAQALLLVAGRWSRHGGSYEMWGERERERGNERSQLDARPREERLLV
jgi:hypothetical protein